MSNKRSSFAKASEDKNKIFVAIAWPYTNGDMHIGHPAGYLLPADVFIRYNRLKGNDVLAVTGSDMHGTPTTVKAEKEGVTPEEYALRYHKSHMDNINRIGLDVSLWTRTSTDNHKEVVQKLFLELQKNGFIIKQKTSQFWSEKESKFLLDRYIEGECPHCHFGKARGDQCDNCGRTLTPDDLINPYSIYGDENLEKRESENFFLDLKKLQPELEKFHHENKSSDRWRKHVWGATEAWLKEGLEPRAITRDLNYGVPLPEGVDLEDKENKVFYVWFEAVTGYLSAAVEYSKRQGGETEDYPETKVTHDDVVENYYSGQSTDWKDWWLSPDSKHYYFMGKDNIPFHSIVWPAALLGANSSRKEGEKFQLVYGLPANQYINLAGTKFSKSTGVILDTGEFVEEFGIDAVRYYLISRSPENKDYDFTWEEFTDAVNNELVANLGNFVNRTLVFLQNNFEGKVSGKVESNVQKEIEVTLDEVGDLLLESENVKAIQGLLKLSGFANKYFDESEIWKVVKEDPSTGSGRAKAEKILVNLVNLVEGIRIVLRPFLPHASERLAKLIGGEEYSPEVGKDTWVFNPIENFKLGGDVKPLFTKLDKEEVLRGNE